MLNSTHFFCYFFHTTKDWSGTAAVDNPIMHRLAFFNLLRTFVMIPTISGSSSFHEQCWHGARFVATTLELVGAKVVLCFYLYFICTYFNKYVQTYMCVYLYAYVCMDKYIYTWYMWMHTCIDAYIFIYIYIACTRMRVCVYIYVCMYTYI